MDCTARGHTPPGIPFAYVPHVYTKMRAYPNVALVNKTKQFEHGLGGNTFLDGYKITLLIRGRMNLSSMIDLKIIS